MRQGLEEGIRGEVEGYRAQLEGVKAELAPWEAQMKEVQARIDVAASERDLLTKQHEQAVARHADAKAALAAAQAAAKERTGQIKEMEASVEKYRWVGGRQWAQDELCVRAQAGLQKDVPMRTDKRFLSRVGCLLLALPVHTPARPSCILPAAGSRRSRLAPTRRRRNSRLSSLRLRCVRCAAAWSSGAPTPAARCPRARWCRR